METELISLPVNVKQDTRFREIVVEAVGDSLFSCYQCCKCSAGCPVVFAMDILPHQIIRSVLLHQREPVLSSRTIWVCASCETCTTRCPNEIDIAKVMDVLRQIQVESGTEAKEPKAPVFHKTFLNTIKKFGRIHELFLMANFLRKNGGIKDTLKSGEWKNDLRLGLKMFIRGKLKLLPSLPKGTGELRKLFKQAEEHKKS